MKPETIAKYRALRGPKKPPAASASGLDPSILEMIQRNDVRGKRMEDYLNAQEEKERRAASELAETKRKERRGKLTASYRKLRTGGKSKSKTGGRKNRFGRG